MQTEKRLNEEELKEMYLTYKDALYGFILSRVSNHHDAEDLFSKTFMKFFKYAEKNLIRLDSVKSFLFKIASNTMNDFFRHSSIVRMISLDKYSNDDEDMNLHDIFEDKKAKASFNDIDARDILKDVNEHYKKLPIKQREAFYLRFIQNFSFENIAKIQGTNLSTALSRVRYAVLKIRESMKEKMEV